MSEDCTMTNPSSYPAPSDEIGPYACPCGIGEEKCPGSDGKPLCDRTASSGAGTQSGLRESINRAIEQFRDKDKITPGAWHFVDDKYHARIDGEWLTYYAGFNLTKFAERLFAALTQPAAPQPSSAENGDVVEYEKLIREKVWASECLTAGEWVYLVGLLHTAREYEDTQRQKTQKELDRPFAANSDAMLSLAAAWRAEAEKHYTAHIELEENGEGGTEEWMLHREARRNFLRCASDLSALPAPAPNEAALREALEECRKEIVRQHDRCRSDADAAPYETMLARIDAALNSHPHVSAGSASEPVACDTIDKIIKQADWYVSVDAHAGLAHHLAKHWPEIRSGLYATPSDRQAIEALTQAKAFILLDSLSPAEHSFEIEKRKAYRENLVAKIDRALAKEQGR
jgi:hypothetical protein